MCSLDLLLTPLEPIFSSKGHNPAMKLEEKNYKGIKLCKS